ncbi:MAG: hypothetical protein E7032_00945 [Akkermansiaceae bacterium]|nr:hypothetical protein [Akkermansiaceae bacterium]
MRAIFLMCFLLFAALVPLSAAPQAGFSKPDQKVARDIVETVYSTWRIGMMRANENAWRSATSKSRQMKVRNLIVSQRGEFPHDFFRNQPEPPSLEKFQYIGTIASGNKQSLAATYVGNVQLGDAKASENAFVLLFVLEDGKWKFDQSRMFNLSRLPKVKERLHKGDLSVLMEQDGFHPYAEAPAVPAACGRPQLIGKVFVDAPGRSIEMKINGISVHAFSDERRADVISGGLRRGKNTISYTITTHEKLAHPAMAIGLFVMPETPGNHPVCVFDHILDASDTAKGGEFTFEISKESIASMNPRFTGTPPQPFHAVPLKKKPAGAK